MPRPSTCSSWCWQARSKDEHAEQRTTGTALFGKPGPNQVLTRMNDWMMAHVLPLLGVPAEDEARPQGATI